MAERDELGRFISSGNPAGRPRGSENKINREIRELIREALDQEGGSRYLRRAARETPVAFLALIGRLMVIIDRLGVLSLKARHLNGPRSD